MNKGLLWLGISLFTLGAAAFLFYVLPWILGARSETLLATSGTGVGPSTLAVVLATFGLAVGSALVGIGVGHWRRPKPSQSGGSPEV